MLPQVEMDLTQNHRAYCRKYALGENALQGLSGNQTIELDFV